MRLSISILGTEVLAVSTDPAADDTSSGEATAYPVGFAQPVPMREALPALQEFGPVEDRRKP